MSLIRRATGNVLHRAGGFSSQGDPWSIPTNGSLSNFSSTGLNVNETTALQLLSVTACVRILSETVSGLPLDAVTSRGSFRTPVEPAPQIIADPFGGADRLSGYGLTRKIGFAQMMMSLLLRGNAYAAVVSVDENGQPDMLQVLSPDAVDVDVDRQTSERLYKVNHVPFPSSRMLHIPGLMLPGQPTGLSVVGYAARTIGLGIAAEEFGAKFFGSGAHMSGVIEVPGDLKPEVARQMKESFEANHSGMNVAHAVGVLTAGAKFAPISVSPEDAQFLGTRSMQTTDIAMLFGIPPHMLGQVDRTTSWGKGIEEQTLGFLKYTLSGWVNRFEDAFSALLPHPTKAWFNLDALLRPDTTARYAAYMSARNGSILTPNEIRAKEDYPPVEGGDDLFAPLNSAHTTDPGFQPGQPKPATLPGGSNDDNAPPA